MSGATHGSGTSTPGLSWTQHRAPEPIARPRSVVPPTGISVSAGARDPERVVVADRVERAHPLERQHVGVEHLDVVQRVRPSAGVAYPASPRSRDRRRSPSAPSTGSSSRCSSVRSATARDQLVALAVTAAGFLSSPPGRRTSVRRHQLPSGAIALAAARPLVRRRRSTYSWRNFGGGGGRWPSAAAAVRSRRGHHHFMAHGIAPRLSCDMYGRACTIQTSSPSSTHSTSSGTSSTRRTPG